MGDAESGLPPSKKRVAGPGRELSKDNADLDDDTPEEEMGTFERAGEEVLATRRIVKVRHHQPQSASSSSNPFAGLCFTPPLDSIAETTSATAESQITGDGNHDKIVKDNEIDSGALVNGPSGEEEGNKKLEDITDVSAAKDNKNLESDAVEVTTQPKEVDRGGEEIHGGATDKTDKEDRKDPQKEAGEEVEILVKKEGDEKTVEENEKEARRLNDKVVGGEIEDGKDGNDQEDSVNSVSFSSFQHLSSSQNAFAGLAKTGFLSSSFSFGPTSKEGAMFGANCGPLFGVKGENLSHHSFGIGSSKNGSSFGTSASDATKATVSGLASLQEVPVETGEEHEKVAFSADAILYEYLDGGWKERGKGEVKVNTSISGVEKARLVMRAKGNYRLILNASLYPDMTLTNMEKRGITFACMSSVGEGKGGLTTFALKFKDSCTVEEFRGAVTAHKGNESTVLKTPENSPKASDE